MKGDSTTNQLIYVSPLIRSTWPSGNFGHGLFLDVAAAFEKVWYDELREKLKQNKISESCFDLFKQTANSKQETCCSEKCERVNRSMLDLLSKLTLRSVIDHYMPVYFGP